MRQGILVLDFGSQYTQLIARRIREMNVYSEIRSYLVKETDVCLDDFCGIILSGGPASSHETDSPKIPEWVFNTHCPVLGICYGMQAMALQCGGAVQPSDRREYGPATLYVEKNNALFAGLATDAFDVWMSHGDHVTRLPEDFECIAHTENAPIAAMASKDRPWFGVQFHPEVTHTLYGVEILQAFVLGVCQAPASWRTELLVDELIQTIRAQVGTQRVLLALSGGVDSSVLALLLHRAIGDQLQCIFVDTGFLRKNERLQIQAMFAPFELSIEYVSAADDFLKAVAGITCPEEKRKTIGRLFIDVFTRESKAFAPMHWLAQGTIYPDVIESADQASGAALIKSHHNVGGLPDALPFKLLEPLRRLFKDEVRQLGETLGLPHAMVYRHPFPGPGLAVRMLGEIQPAYLELLADADAIFIEMLRASGWYEKVSQAFAVFLPVKSVGVVGDGRQYEYVISLRAVVTHDFMTATIAHLPWSFLESVSNRIINEVKGISRVVYDISSKPPATIEWE